MSAPALALLVAATLLAPAAPGEARGAVGEPAAGEGEGQSPQPSDAHDASAVTDAAAVDAALRIRTQQVDPAAVQQGLSLRVGEGWRRWTIEVDDDAAAAGRVDVRLHDRAGHVHARSLTLEGRTVDERSRALASALALLVEQLAAQDEPPPAAEPTPVPRRRDRPPPPAGFLAVGPRVALNPGAPLHVDVGASLVGGAWLVRDHLVPVGELAWARSTAGELTVDALRVGAGLLGGAAGPRGRLWGGGGALVRAQWAVARASSRDDGWWASPAVVGAIQYRGRILVIGAWLGTDLMLPPLRARGDAHALRWAVVRPMASLQMGLRLPPRR